MRVLIVHDYGTLSGGAEQLSVLLRDGLRRRGHDAWLFASSARPLGIEIVADFTCFGTTSPGRKVLQAANPWAAHRLAEVVREHRPDVVHLRMFHTQLSPLVLRSVAGIPTVLHVGSYEMICPLLTKTLPDGSSCPHHAGWACHDAGCVSLAGVARMSVQRALRERWRSAITRIVANSEWTSRRLQRDGVRVDEWVWNGVPVCAQRPPLSWPPTVAYAGRLVHKKGVDVLVRAMGIVVRSLPGARLVIAGDGPERAAIQHLIESHDLHAHVLMLGHRSRTELDGDLAPAWVQALPSRWEDPFPNAAAEAAMRGTAIVASNWGGVTEIVRQGETGLLVQPGEPDALASALIELLRDRQAAERLGSRARELALAELTEDRFIERFEQIYARLIAPQLAGGRRAVRAAAELTT